MNKHSFIYYLSIIIFENINRSEEFERELGISNTDYLKQKNL